jgi:hypothetical protein
LVNVCVFDGLEHLDEGLLREDIEKTGDTAFVVVHFHDAS